MPAAGSAARLMVTHRDAARVADEESVALIARDDFPA